MNYLLPLIFTLFSVVYAQECEEGQRLFEHDLLATNPLCIPESPERVVALEPHTLDVLLSTGSMPVGAIGYLENVVGDNFDYLQDEFGEITNLGFPVNVEATLQADPDLIVVSSFQSDLYEELSAIAPTVMYESLPNAQWQESTRFVAQVLNLEAETEELLASYEARLADLREAVSENAGDPGEVAVSVIRIFDNSGSVGLQMQLAHAFSSGVLGEVGFARPESQAYSPEEAEARFESAVAATLSLEQLPLLDGDVLIAWSQGADEEQDAANTRTWSEIRESPLWGSLEVVQEGETYRAGGYWVGWGLHAAHAVVDDLFTFVAGVDPQEVSPNPFLIEETSN